MQTNVLNLKLVDKIQQTQDAVSFCFKKPFLKDVSYKSGQYLTLHVNIDGQLHKRAYSLNSTSGLDKTLSVTVKRVPGGKVSNYLIDNIEPGQTLKVDAPQGEFYFEPSKKKGRKIILIGGGSGITPLFSIMKNALAKEPLSKVQLYYFNRNSDSVIFKEQIRKVKQEYNGRFDYKFFLDEISIEIDTACRRVSKDGLNKLLKIPPIQFDNCLFYICGPEGLMQIAYDGLIAMGVKDKTIHLESFTGRFKRVEEPEIEGVASKVVYKRRKETHEFDVKPNQTILEAAKEHGVPMMYSCCSGSCGSCVCRVKEGKVDMEGNKVLRPQETKYGYFLTCVGRPQTETIIMEEA